MEMFSGVVPSRGRINRRQGPPEGPVPPDGRSGQPGGPGKRAQLRPPKAAQHRHRAVVLYHRGEVQGAAEAPDPHIGEEVPVEVVHEKAVPGHPLHLRKHPDRRGAVKVMQKQGRVGDVDGPGIVGKGLGVPDLDTDPVPKTGGQVLVEMGPGMAHRDGVGVNADEVQGAPEALASPGQVDQVVSAPAPHVQQTEAIVVPERRVEGAIRGPVPSEQPVDASEVAEGPRETSVRDRKIIHPLLGFQAR